MKNIGSFICIIVITGLVLLLMPGCKKEGNAVVPAITSATVSDITPKTALSGGEIISDGGAQVTARGVCWSTNNNPDVTCSKTVDGTGSGSFASSITGLLVNVTYYLRAYATNSAGTGYGAVLSFKTPFLEAGTDIDGNVYHAVEIGTQVWMVENLKTTRYRNGDPIPIVTDNVVWSALTTGAYCWYNNDIANKVDYGALYNLYAANDNRKLAPSGWHIPTTTEWNTLINYAGGEYHAYNYLLQNLASTPGGYMAGTRDGSSGQMEWLGTAGWWWSISVPVFMDNGILPWVHVDSEDNISHTYGFSIRCIKD